MFAEWEGLSCHIEIILEGAPPRAGWWIKRIATNTAYSHGVTECFVWSSHMTYLISVEMMIWFGILQLGSGFKDLLCSSLPGEMIQFDEHIFQMD